MNLYYLTAVELKKGTEVEDTHAIIARDTDHLSERCGKLFVRWSDVSLGHKLNNDWDEKFTT